MQFPPFLIGIALTDGIGILPPVDLFLFLSVQLPDVFAVIHDQMLPSMDEVGECCPLITKTVYYG